jgi:hypothetical protein
MSEIGDWVLTSTFSSVYRSHGAALRDLSGFISLRNDVVGRYLKVKQALSVVYLLYIVSLGWLIRSVSLLLNLGEQSRGRVLGHENN